MTFNWQDMGRDQFLGWLLPTTLAKHSPKEVERFGEATDHFQAVTITMQINGIEVHDAERFLIEMGAQYDQQVEADARRLLDEHTRYMEAEDIVSAAFSEARQAIRQQLQALGLNVEDHRGDS